MPKINIVLDHYFWNSTDAKTPAVSYMQAIRSYHNVVKEPICTLLWQSLALDQLKYLQIALK